MPGAKERGGEGASLGRTSTASAVPGCTPCTTVDVTGWLPVCVVGSGAVVVACDWLVIGLRPATSRSAIVCPSTCHTWHHTCSGELVATLGRVPWLCPPLSVPLTMACPVDPIASTLRGCGRAGLLSRRLPCDVPLAPWRPSGLAIRCFARRCRASTGAPPFALPLPTHTCPPVPHLEPSCGLEPLTPHCVHVRVCSVCASVGRRMRWHRARPRSVHQ